MIDVKVTAEGLDEVKQTLIKLQSAYNTIVEQELEKFLNDVLLERIVVNTPIRTGRLRRSLEVQKVQFRAGRAKFLIQSPVPYALRMHEEEFKLGPVSRRQPSQPEGGVGNKYIERVVFFHADALKKILGGVPSLLIRKLYPSGRTRTIRRERA